jgi:serine phosphatase RsbU (regulator of sigma subunit)
MARHLSLIKDCLQCFEPGLQPSFLEIDSVNTEKLLQQIVEKNNDIIFVHESCRFVGSVDTCSLEYEKNNRKHSVPIFFIGKKNHCNYKKLSDVLSASADRKRVLIFEKPGNFSPFLRKDSNKKTLHVISCSDKKTGLSLIAKTHPDIIIIDVEATNLDAFSLCRKLRHSRNFAKTPILLISSFSESSIVENILEKGASDYIFKPCENAELLQKIKFHLKIENTTKEKILVVDDCMVTLTLLTDILEEQGYEVSTAKSGTEGLEKAFRNPPDLITTDYLMPEMDGWAFCCKLNQHPETKNIPTIMISAKKSEIDFRKARVLRVEDYITKPINPVRLIDSVRYALLRSKRDKQTQKLLEIDKEFVISRSIQQNFMPPPDYDIEDCLKIRAAWSPARQLGGDFYWFNAAKKKTDDIILAIADVSGKGMSSALIASAAQSCLQSVSKFTISPAELLSHLNMFLFESPNMDRFITCFLARINFIKKTINYSSAGHQRMLFYQASTKTILELSSSNLPCGLEQDEIFEEKSISYEKGDHLILYTDGLVDARNPQNEFYSFEKLHQKLLNLFLTNADKKTEIIFHDVIAFSRELPQTDDITLLIAELL